MFIAIFAAQRYLKNEVIFLAIQRFMQACLCDKIK